MGTCTGDVFLLKFSGHLLVKCGNTTKQSVQVKTASQHLWTLSQNSSATKTLGTSLPLASDFAFGSTLPVPSRKLLGYVAMIYTC